MSLARAITRLVVGTFAAFGIVALAAAYWAIAGPDTVALRDDNPRLVVEEAALLRGHILDRNGDVLAASQVNDNQQVMRIYPHPEVSSLVGYSSLRYGVAGTEYAYDSILRGDNQINDVTQQFADDLLHRRKIGTDIKISLDLEIQQTVSKAMAGQTGAVIVMAVPSGQILSLVSLPGYDPNRLDSNWDELVASPDEPFFNRALQGRYQPGGTLQTPLMSAAILANVSLTENIRNATNPVQLDDIELSCALRLPFTQLSLRDAYGFACPRPFTQLVEQLGSQTMNTMIQTFQFNKQAELQGYSTEPPITQEITVEEDTLMDNALGQGELTVTPLDMAVMAAAIINDGNAPQPYTLLETRAPGNTVWNPVLATRPTTPFTTQNTARQLQDLMRNAVANGGALNAARPNMDIGGHATLAFSGDQSQAWFIGFATLEGQRAVAVAIVIENSRDPGLAADIGGTILEAAHQALRLPQTTPQN